MNNHSNSVQTSQMSRQQQQSDLDFDKKEWVRLQKQLKKEYGLEDKERYRPLFNLKREMPDFYEEVEKEEKKNDITLKKEYNGLLSIILKQRTEVDQARNMINNSKNDPGLLDKIHSKVKGIESNLKNFKLKSRSAYEQLADEEQTIMNELEMWEAKFEQYAQEKADSEISTTSSRRGGVTKIGQRASSVSNRLFSHKNQSETISEVDEGEIDESEKIKMRLEEIEMQLMKNGGLNCGWDASDHKDFLRIRTKHGNRVQTVAFYQELMRAVPNLDDDRIREHVKQYDTYLDLTDQKKNLLNEYKEVKKQKQKEKVQKLENQDKMMDRLNSDLDLVGVNENKNTQNLQEKEQLKQQLENWKKDKEEQKKKEIEEKKRREEQMKERERQRLEEERRQKREQVEEFKFKKEMEKQREKQLQEMERRKKESQLTQEQKERIFKREEEVFMKKHQKIIKKQEEEEIKKQRMEELKEKVSKGLKEKVESKLNQETKAMKDKKREKFDEKKDQRKDAMTMGGNLLGLSVRAMPMWRQGI